MTSIEKELLKWIKHGDAVNTVIEMLKVTECFSCGERQGFDNCAYCGNCVCKHRRDHYLSVAQREVVANCVGQPNIGSHLESRNLDFGDDEIHEEEREGDMDSEDHLLKQKEDPSPISSYWIGSSATKCSPKPANNHCNLLFGNYILILMVRI